MSDIAIEVEDLSKQYRLGVIGTGTLSHDLNRWWHLVRGKEDPYLKVGEVNDRSSLASSDLVWALRDINFEVKRGEVLGIIGKNGAGKSTLLKILSKVTSPSTGRIRVWGRIASLLEVGTGFHPELTGRENIFLNGAILGMTKAEIRSKLDEIIDFSGCERYIDTPVKRYSSGMKVRLAFAVAAHLEPEILIIDEVLAVGDAEFQQKALGKMQEVSQGHGRTVLFVSHNMDAISSLCPMSLLLDKGTVVRYESTESVIHEYLGFTKLCARQELNLKSNVISIEEIRILNRFDDLTYLISWNEPFRIQVYYHVHEIRDWISIGLVVIASNGVPVLTTASRNAQNAKNLNKGYGIAMVEIPAQFLSPGDYSIFLNAHNLHEVFCSDTNIIAFRIEDEGREIIGREGNMKWPGVVSPNFLWTIS